jgi:hypothetical protein
VVRWRGVLLASRVRHHATAECLKVIPPSELSEAGLKGDLHELAGALRIALTVPDSAQQWLADEEAEFAAARLNW